MDTLANQASSTKHSPPGPDSTFVLANLAMLQKDWLGFLARCTREYGDMVHLRLATMEIYLLNRPEYLEYVLVTNHHNFIKDFALRTHQAIYGNGLLTSEGNFWLRQRRLAQPAFHRARIAEYSKIMVTYAERLLATWQDQDTRDVHQEMVHLSLEIVSKTLFGADATDEAASYTSSVPTATSGQAATSGHGKLFGIDLVGDEWIHQLDTIIYGLIDKRRKGGQDTGDLLSLLLSSEYEDGSHMSDKQLRDELVTILLAGYDTTALSLSWTWYLLAEHPEIEAKLLAELQTVLGGRVPTIDDLPALRYTDMIVKEVLRLYPPIWGFGREALQDCQIGEYVIPRGATVFLSQWLIHRDARYFDDPEAFKPERWENDLAKSLPKCAYIPFSSGPRLCIGSAFASTAAVLILATIAQKFRLTLVPGQEITPLPALTLQPKNGINMVLHRRSLS